MLMNFKKLVSYALSAAMLAGLAAAPAMADTSSASSYVLYENDFENYTGGAFATTVTAGQQGWTGITNTGDLKAVTVNGNTIIDPQGGTRWTFDMGEALTSGKIYISYDVEITDVEGSDSKATSNYIRYKYKDTDYKYLLYTDVVNKKFYTNANLNNSGIQSSYSFGEDNKFKVDIVYDIQNSSNKGSLSVAINGDVQYTVTRSKLSFYSIEFLMSQEIAMDNFKIAYMADDSFTAKVETVRENSFDIKFSESVKTVTTDNVKVTDASGNDVPVSNITVDNFGKAVLTLQNGLKSKQSYNVAFSGITNVFGSALSTTALTFTAPLIPERKTVLNVDTPEEFTKLNLTGFEEYTDADGVSGAKWNHSATELKDESENVTGYNPKGSDNRYITFDAPAYAIGDITFEYRAYADENTNLFKTYLNFVTEGLYSACPYINGSNGYGYQNISTAASGKYQKLTGTDLRGAWHTHKIVFHCEEQTADIYLDNELIGTYKFNNFDGLVKKGSYLQLRLDYNVSATQTAAIPYVLFDYIKITQEYYPNESGLYILQNELREGAEAVSEISAGDTLSARAYVLNLTGEAYSGYLLGGVYNGEELTAADSVYSTAENGSVMGGTLDLTIADTTDLVAKSFLWNGNLTPLAQVNATDSSMIVESEEVTE